ncbi:MAG: hypothetical protein N2316_09905 [Spirochaetes bacterium]|nr:hypothetical protein [Spirochaetota bacterium]
MQPDLENLKKRIGESRDLVDKVIDKLPGYTGYVEKGELYEADRVVRSFVASKLLDCKKYIDEIIRSETKKNSLQHLADLESIHTLLEKAHKKCAYAEFGRSASSSKINPTTEEMTRLIEFDWRMIAKADELEAELAKLSGVQGDLSSEIDRIRKIISDFENDFDQRKNIVLEVL